MLKLNIELNEIFLKILSVKWTFKNLIIIAISITNCSSFDTFAKVAIETIRSIIPPDSLVYLEWIYATHRQLDHCWAKLTPSFVMRSHTLPNGNIYYRLYKEVNRFYWLLQWKFGIKNVIHCTPFRRTFYDISKDEKMNVRQKVASKWITSRKTHNSAMK